MTKWSALLAPLLALGCLTPAQSSESSTRSPTSPSAPPPADTTRASTQGLAAEEVRLTVMKHLGAFDRCFARAVASGIPPEGGLLVAFTIAPEGHVTGASVAESTLDALHVTNCVLAVFRRIEFPPGDKPTNASFPFVSRTR